MTNKEMAAKHATVFTNLNYNEPDNYGTPKEIGYHAYHCGFLAGLAEGRLKWNKVAEGVLPDNCRYVWTNEGAGYHDNDGWWDEYGMLQGVVAWCEPKFLEEISE